MAHIPDNQGHWSYGSFEQVLPNLFIAAIKVMWPF